MSFVDILQTLWRRRLVFLVTFIVAEAAVIGVTFALPKTYTATATLYVGSAQVNRQLAFDSNLGQQLARTYVTLAGNPNVADDVVSQLAQQGLHKTRTELLDQVSFTPVEQTQLIQISADSGSKAGATVLANTYAQVFQAHVAQQAQGNTGLPNVALVEPAVAPSGPSKPNPPLYIGLGTVLALVLAVGAALLRDRLDTRIRVADDDSTLFGHPILARVPNMGRRMDQERIGDALRVLRTNIGFVEFSTARVLMITSPRPREGKSTISAMLATEIARGGEKVVVIEADLRRPMLDRSIGARDWVRSTIGLSDHLEGRALSHDIITTHREMDNLRIVWAGAQVGSPATVLRSPKLKVLVSSLRLEHDWVIIDSPPVSVGADASLLAQQADAVVYLLDIRSTDRVSAQAGLNQLERVRARVVGLVLNNDESQAQRYSYYDRGNSSAGGDGVPEPARRARA